MPQTGNQEGDHSIEQFPELTLPVAAQGDVHILPEPAAQGHMPPAPELPEGFGQIRHIEILAHGDAKHPGQTQHHIDTAGEVAVKLQGVQEHGSQGIGALVFGRIRADGADNDAKSCRDHILLHQAPYRPGSALKNAFPGDPAARQRPAHGIVALDGANKQMGNISHKQGVAEQIPLRLILSLIHIHIVGNDLQGKV